MVCSTVIHGDLGACSGVTPPESSGASACRAAQLFTIAATGNASGGAPEELGDLPSRNTYTWSTMAPFRDGGDETLTLLRHVRDDLGSTEAKARASVYKATVILSTIAAYATVAERSGRPSSAWEITTHALSEAATVLHTLSDRTVVARAGQDIGATELPEVDRPLNELIGLLIKLGESGGTASHEVAPVRQAGVSATLHLRRAAEELP